MRISRILGVWVLLAVFMVTNGAFREVFLVQWMDVPLADQVSAMLGVVIVLGVSRPFLIHAGDRRRGDELRIGGMWLALTIGFELLLGWATGETWAEMASAYAIWNGALWAVVLLAVAGAPFLWTPRPEALARATHT